MANVFGLHLAISHSETGGHAAATVLAALTLFLFLLGAASSLTGSFYLQSTDVVDLATALGVEGSLVEDDIDQLPRLRLADPLVVTGINSLDLVGEEEERKKRKKCINKKGERV